MTRSHGRAGLAALWLTLWPTLATAQPSPAVEMATVDRATVRVFSLQGIGAALIKGRVAKHWTAFAELGHGSGFLVSGDGLVLTAHHVVEGAAMLAIAVPGSEQLFPAQVLHEDADHDVAVLAIAASTPNFIRMPEVGPTMHVRQPIFAIGYPLDGDRTLPQSSRGIVAGSLPDGNVQLDMSVNPGNSGGPVVGEDNTLFGLIVARGNLEAGVQGIAVAVPTTALLAARDAAAAAPRTVAAANETLAVVLEGAKALYRIAALPDAADPTPGAPLGGQVEYATLRAKLERQLQRGVHAGLVRALIAALDWNQAIKMRETATPSWRTFKRSGAKLAYQAGRESPALLESSRFVRIAQRRHVVTLP